MIFTRREADLLMFHFHHLENEDIFEMFNRQGITGKNQDEASIVVFIVGKDETCPFLVDNKCQVYDFRPKRCRLFPFWPEYFTSDEKFDMKGRECQGVTVKEVL